MKRLLIALLLGGCVQAPTMESLTPYCRENMVYDPDPNAPDGRAMTTGNGLGLIVINERWRGTAKEPWIAKHECDHVMGMTHTNTAPSYVDAFGDRYQVVRTNKNYNGNGPRGVFKW